MDEDGDDFDDDGKSRRTSLTSTVPMALLRSPAVAGGQGAEWTGRTEAAGR